MVMGRSSNPWDAMAPVTSPAISANAGCFSEQNLMMNFDAVIALMYFSFWLSAIAAWAAAESAELPRFNQQNVFVSNRSLKFPTLPITRQTSAQKAVQGTAKQ